MQASRPEASNAISNAVEKTQVKESESSYCDSTAAADLVFAAKLGGLRFFVAREILNPCAPSPFSSFSPLTHLRSRQARLRTITPRRPPSIHHSRRPPCRRSVRRRPSRSPHLPRPLRPSDRFQPEWVAVSEPALLPRLARRGGGEGGARGTAHQRFPHVGAVRSPLDSCCGWLADEGSSELAHNLVGPHDAEHSFYFSSLCEEKFLCVLSSVANESTADVARADRWRHCWRQCALLRSLRSEGGVDRLVNSQPAFGRTSGRCQQESISSRSATESARRATGKQSREEERSETQDPYNAIRRVAFFIPS